MRCVRCQSENMPGQQRCFKCGSILGAEAVVDIHPPRMPAWKGPFREIMRGIRGLRRPPAKPQKRRGHELFTRAASDALVGVVLNVIPGLAHALNQRFREVKLLVLAWVVLLSLGLFLYGSTVGFILVGLAIGVHVWIALKFGLFDEIGDIGTRIGAIFVGAAMLTALYWAVPRAVFWGYATGYTTLKIPDMSIESGDYLLIRRIDGAETPVARGTLVWFRPTNQYGAAVMQPLTVGQVIGLPGEKVSIVKGIFSVDGQTLNAERFPVPHWIRNRPLQISVPRGSYFVSSEYTVGGHGMGLTEQAIRTVTIVSGERIRGRAFMRWWPLGRRGFIE